MKIKYNTLNSYINMVHNNLSYDKLNFTNDGRCHYVYRITDTTSNTYYYGSRVTTLDPYNDLGHIYFSSSTLKEFINRQKLHRDLFRYKIIKTFDNAGDAIIFESFLHQYFDVVSNTKFINLSNQSPFGFIVTGNRNIVNKRLATMNKQDSETGKTKYEESGIKGQKTKSAINPDTNQTYYHDIARKSADTMIANNTYISIAEKSKISKRKPDPITGLTPIETGIPKFIKTVATKDSDGIKLSTKIAISAARTMSKKDPVTGKSIYDLHGENQRGENNPSFKGWYIMHNVAFTSIRDINNSIKGKFYPFAAYCRKSENLITSHGYHASKYFKSLSLDKSEIIGLYYRDFGFHFKPKSA